MIKLLNYENFFELTPEISREYDGVVLRNIPKQNYTRKIVQMGRLTGIIQQTKSGERYAICRRNQDERRINTN